jgi:hypothetical protein
MDGELDVHHGGDTHNGLCCHDLVAECKTQNQPGEAEQMANVGVSRCQLSHGNGCSCCNCDSSGALAALAAIVILLGLSLFHMEIQA